ncbi:hypothetical protein ACIGGE_16155 [Qipengyuania sp. NPDC077410]|uniref:hypothetical protein n=1 Tax=Qipengyuania sp. NPDC077410 TaxID=3364496 RepID=UPI0037C5798C
MANQTITEETIAVHGRGSLVLPYKVQNANGEQVDISDWSIYFEVDGNPYPIREPLVPDPNDPLGQRIVLERQQVAMLTKSPSRFSVIDETNMGDDLPYVLWEGTIKRTGYVGEPDNIPDAGD